MALWINNTREWNMRWRREWFPW